MSDIKLPEPTKDISKAGFNDLMFKEGMINAESLTRYEIVPPTIGSIEYAIDIEYTLTVDVTLVQVPGFDATADLNVPYKDNRVYAVPPKILAFRDNTTSFEPLPIYKFKTTLEPITSSFMTNDIARIFSRTSDFQIQLRAPLGTLASRFVVCVLKNKSDVNK